MRRGRPSACRVEAPGANLPLDLSRACDQSIHAYSGSKNAEVARLALVLRVTRSRPRHPLEHGWAGCSPTAVASFGASSSQDVLVAERDPLLREDVPRIELGVHVVEREADLALAVAGSPTTPGSARDSGEAATDGR